MTNKAIFASQGDFGNDSGPISASDRVSGHFVSEEAVEDDGDLVSLEGMVASASRGEGLANTRNSVSSERIARSSSPRERTDNPQENQSLRRGFPGLICLEKFLDKWQTRELLTRQPVHLKSWKLSQIRGRCCFLTIFLAIQTFPRSVMTKIRTGSKGGKDVHQGFSTLEGRAHQYQFCPTVICSMGTNDMRNLLNKRACYIFGRNTDETDPLLGQVINKPTR